MEMLKAYETPQGPQLELLGEVETKLPTPLKKRGMARTVALALALASVLLIGGAKLRGEYNSVKSLYTEGSERDGYSISFNLQNRQDAAANIITVGGQVLGQGDTALENAQQALEALDAARQDGGPAQQYAADSALGKAVDLLYQTMAASDMDADKASALQTQWSEFLSRADIISHMDYNDRARQYNQAASGLPARLIAALWGCGEVELFA